MHTESNAIFLTNIHQQPNHLEQHTQYQQNHVNHISQEHPLTEEHQQQICIHSPSTTMEVATSLREGLYTPTTQQPLTSGCLSQYYSCATKHGYPTTSSSSSSSSGSSSDESNYYPLPANNNNGKQTTSIGVNLRVTGQCSQGGRKYMEDYFSVAYQQSDNAKDLEYAFIGIYDGHGGAEAAKFAKEHLMMEIINQRLFWSENDHDVLRAIREGYIATHYAMWREQDKWPKTANGLPSTAGTTATIAFIRKEKIYIGHVGDSGIVLGYQNENENFWRAKQLTTDHKPESVEERTRIMNSGGKVLVKSGVPRVVWNRPRNASHRGPIRKKTLIDEIPFLAVARSLGDLWSYNPERNEFVVSPDPDVRVIPINPNTFRCLIFGTDGLWNVVCAQEAVNTVREKEMINECLLAQRGDNPNAENQWTNPSKSLVEQALRTWSQKKMRADNTSVVTVILYPPGQVDHNMDNISCDELNNKQSASSFVQHISYGLEYTEVHAEVPPRDGATTYKEMAIKYLPPEPYRNFNYYADESDTDGGDNDNEEGEDILIEKPAGDIEQNSNYAHHYITSNDCNWHQDTVDTVTKTENDENEDDEGESESEPEENVIKLKYSNNERQVSVIGFQNYGHMEAEETNNATDSYINTFAESYNSILTTSQDDCLIATAGCSPSSSLSNNSNSNSNSNCQSVTPPNMHAILQEQQLYQQQCMSEEEGYSLTKLETRREQLTFRNHNRNSNISNETTPSVQTFKIFHEPAVEPQQIGMHQTNSERFYHQQQQFMSHLLPKPLELHSLLQQEREVEQQVAYERLQMANKLHHHQQNIASYACLQSSTSSPTMQQSNEQPSAEFEYLEDESSITNGEIITPNTLCLQQDESIQIHEISSSSCVESLSKINCSEINAGEVEIIEKIEILPNFNFEMCNRDEPAEGKLDLNNSLYSSIPIPERNSCLPPPQAPPALSKHSKAQQSRLSHSKRTKSKYLYNNVTNENLQRISSKSKYNRSRYTSSESAGNSRRSICLTPSTSMTPPAATSTPSIQRQLRSSSSPCSSTPKATAVIDYGKRTLRARNSLSKDMKAKSSLVQTALKYPQNAVTRSFLRTTAANLIVAKPLHINELNVTACNMRSLNKANNVHSTSRSSIRTRREKCSVTLNGSLSQCKTNKQNSTPSQLNLRSRQASSPPSAASSLSTPPTAATIPVIKRASLNERRILRSTHTRSSSAKGSQPPASFSKTTRTQSSGSNLAAPPPSPKLINSVVAVAAATRARTLLNAKHVAAANGTQSVVSSVFGKRSSLRSNVSTHPTALSNANTSSISTPPAIHHTLRGRIVKKLKR